MDIDRERQAETQRDERGWQWRRIETLEREIDELASKGREYKHRAEVAELDMKFARKQIRGLQNALKIARKNIKHPARFARVRSL